MYLEHVALAHADPVAGAAWYERHLGFRTVRSSAEPPYAHFLAAPGGDVMIEFFNDAAVAVPDYWEVHAMQGHLAFAEADLEAAGERLVSAGAVTEGPPASTPGGDRFMMLRDPWGVPLQLVTRLVRLDAARRDGDAGG